MDFKFLLCLAMISPVFGENLLQQSSEGMDRARSAWNFVGQHTARKAALLEWASKRRHSPGETAIANRRMGTLPKHHDFGVSTKKSTKSEVPSLFEWQRNLYSNPGKLGKMAKINRNSGPSVPASSLPASVYSPTYFSRPNHNKEQRSSMPVWSRKKRSTDSLKQDPTMPVSTPVQSQTSSLPIMLSGNQRMSSVPSRKHYSSTVSSGKPSAGSNLKVPATIIAPPAFDKGDILSMLMGSGGVNPNTLGTILATNSRYVRFGKSLPSGDYRTGRKINWFPDATTNQFHNQSPSLTSSPSSQQPMASSSNQMFSVVKPPQNFRPASASSQQTSPLKMATPHIPVILNVQITPIGARAPPSSGPVITVPIPHAYPAASAPLPQQMEKEKLGEGYKYTEYWKPSLMESYRPQKPFQYTKFSPDLVQPQSLETQSPYENAKPEHVNEMENSNIFKSLSFTLKNSNFNQVGQEPAPLFFAVPMTSVNYNGEVPSIPVEQDISSSNPQPVLLQDPEHFQNAESNNYYAPVRNLAAPTPDTFMTHVPKDDFLSNEIKK